MADGGEQRLFLTTQPGWAFATLAELRSHKITEYAAFYHRDSSILVRANESVRARKLATPDNAYGCLVSVNATKRQDATEVLRRHLVPDALRQHVLAWLSSIQTVRQRRYSINTEVYGNTSVHRRRLSELIERGLSSAFPGWRRTASGGIQIFCRADPRVAILGLQLYSNLSRGDIGRPGALRDHMACGLLTLARTQPGDAVFDPFAGTGTVLKMARERFQAGPCVGLETDAEAYDIAKRRLDDPRISLINASFEGFDMRELPPPTKLVSNIPFGVRFERVPTEKLVQFIRQPPLKGARVVLLMSRGQAEEMTAILDFKRKNVLVLGQPASILQGVA